MYTFAICGWGVWRTYKGLKTADDDESRVVMLKYWAVYAAFVIYDNYFDWIVRWIPGYGMAKLMGIAITFLAPQHLRIHEFIFAHFVLPLATIARVISLRSALYCIHFLCNLILHSPSKPSKKETCFLTPALEPRKNNLKTPSSPENLIIADGGLSDLSDASTPKKSSRQDNGPRRSARLSSEKQSNATSSSRDREEQRHQKNSKNRHHRQHKINLHQKDIPVLTSVS